MRIQRQFEYPDALLVVVLLARGYVAIAVSRHEQLYGHYHFQDNGYAGGDDEHVVHVVVSAHGGNHISDRLDAVRDQRRLRRAHDDVLYHGDGGRCHTLSAGCVHKIHLDGYYDITLHARTPGHIGKVGYDKAPGVEFGIYDFIFGIGFKANAVQEPDFDLLNKKALTLFAKTPEIAVIDGLTIQAGATYALQDAGFIDADDKEINAFGVSAKVAYASDLLSASFATDMGYDALAEEFGADVAANVTYDFVGVDFYYATAAANSGVDGGKVTIKDPDTNVVVAESDYKDGPKVEDLLSLQAKLDLTGFNVPVGLTLTGKDLVNAQDLSATVDLTFGSFKVSPTVGYVVDTELFSAGVAVEYACDYFTAKAETNIKTAFVDDDLVWDATASIENSTLIPGATIKLAWSDGDNLLGNRGEAEHGKILASLKLDF